MVDEGVGAGVEVLHGGEEFLVGLVAVGDDAFVGVEVGGVAAFFGGVVIGVAEPVPADADAGF